MDNQPTLAQRLKDLEDNPTLLSFYAKSSCKKCLGRGKITMNVRSAGGWVDQPRLCDCVQRAIKKEMNVNG